MEGSSGSDRTVRLTPNYVLMKINRYICRSVVSLWTFPRITHAVRLLPPPPPLLLSNSLPSFALSRYLCALRHLFDSLKGIPVSICLFRFIPFSLSLSLPRFRSARLGLRIQHPSRLPLCAPLRSKLNNQFQSRKNLF